MKIAIIGAGNVGGALGTGWAKKGHTVVFGAREPDSPKTAALLAAAGENASAATPVEAAAGADVVALTVPWDAAESALRSLGESLNGKTLLDATNPLLPNLAGVITGPNGESGGEMVARWAPGAKVVKIFNTTGYNNMADTRYPEGAPAMFYAGDDAGAKAAAARLAADLGFEPIDAGPLTRAGLLEAVAMLWINLAYPQGQGREIAFRLMRR